MKQLNISVSTVILLPNSTHSPETTHSLAIFVPSRNTDSTIKLGITHERLRQARWSFNAALIATVICFLIGLTGAVLILSNKVSEGSVTVALGLFSSRCFIKIAKDANDRLDKLSKEMRDEN